MNGEAYNLHIKQFTKAGGILILQEATSSSTDMFYHRI